MTAVNRKSIRRLEDMSPDGFLELYQQDDGDILVTVKESDNDGGNRASVEFCLSGSRSRKTLTALRMLMGAMREDAGIADLQAKWIRYRIFSETPRDAVCECVCPGRCHSIDGEECYEPCQEHEPVLYAEYYPNAGDE